MKSRQWAVAAVMMLSLVAFASVAKAQQAPARPAGTNVAMVDINYIFKTTPRLKQRMEEFTADLARAEDAARKESEDIIKADEELRGLKRGTPDYKDREEQLTKRKSNFQAQLQLQKRELQERKIKIHYEAYQEIYGATEYFCNKAGIDLVIQFNGDQPNADSPESLAAYMGKLVVWYKPAMDVTPEILKILNGATPATATRNNGAATPRQQVPFNR